MISKSTENIKRPFSGRFFILVCSLFIVMAFAIGWAETKGVLIESGDRDNGFSGIKADGKWLLLWNMSNRLAVAIPDYRKGILTQLDGYPITGQIIIPYNRAVWLQYLEPCFGNLSLDKKDLQYTCLGKKDWSPAAFCQTGKNIKVAAFSSLPDDGVEKTFPYYVPVVNRFPYAIYEAGDFRKKRWRIVSSKKQALYDMWHEESAGPWQMKCTEENIAYLLNPTAETLSKISLSDQKEIWKQETGVKPLAFVTSHSRQSIFVVSAQQNEICQYAMGNGEKVGSFKIGKGVRAIEIFRDTLYVVNPYKRSLIRIELNSGITEQVFFNEGIPTAVTIKSGNVLVANGHEAGYWSLSENLQNKKYIPLDIGAMEIATIQRDD